MKIAAYCRVSTDKAEQLESLRNQREFFASFAQRGGHELVGLYADEGISGTSLKKREAFRKLMKDAQSGLFQMVVVKDVSRFARNTVDALQSIRNLKALGINTLFLTANMDSMGDSEFVLTLFSAMAQEESANISKRTKFGKRINAEKGRVPQRVFGYDRIDNFTLGINSEEAGIVQKIFTMYTHQGLGCRTISTRLNDSGDKTKEGCPWNARGVRRVLTNPLYCGILINHKYETENFLTGHQIVLPESQQYVHHRPDWAIVSPEEFREAQRTMESRRTKYDTTEPFRQGRYSSKHLFSTLIKCAHCGRSFCRKTYTYANTRIYWRCATNDQYTAQRCDNRVCLDEKDLILQLQSFFSSMIGNQEAFTANVLSQLEVHRSKTEPAVRLKTEEREKKLLAKRERYQELYANNLMGMEELRKKLSALQAELEVLRGEMKQPENPIEPPLGDGEEIRRFLSLETMTNTQLRRLIDCITVSRDGSVQIQLKKLEPSESDP